MTIDSGKGGVVNGQKNMVLVSDTLNPGFAACKHANGRDWWIVLIKGNSNQIYTWLLTPLGLQPYSLQSIGTTAHLRLTSQPVFSPDGKKFAYRYYYGNIGSMDNEVRVLILTVAQEISVTQKLYHGQVIMEVLLVRLHPIQNTYTQYLILTLFTKSIPILQTYRQACKLLPLMMVIIHHNLHFNPISGQCT